MPYLGGGACGRWFVAAIYLPNLPATYPSPTCVTHCFIAVLSQWGGKVGKVGDFQTFYFFITIFLFKLLEKYLPYLPKSSGNGRKQPKKQGR